MAVPLIAAGIKVAGKALIKKLGAKLAQKGAQQLAKKGAQKLAQEGAKKIGTSVAEKGTSSSITSQVQKAKNLYNKVEDVKKTKDNILGKDDQEKPSNSTAKTQHQAEASHQKSDTDQPSKKAESKWPFYIALFFAIIKDAIEIWLSPAAPVLTFLPTIIITSVLLLSGKKGTMKIVMSLLTTLVDFLLPAVNVLPMTSIAVFFALKPENNKLPIINSDQIQKIMKNVKKFIK